MLDVAPAEGDGSGGEDRREAVVATLAYLFVECLPDHVKGALSRLKRIPAVREAHIVIGEYDVIAMMEAPDAQALSEAVLSKIHSIPGVKRTTPNLAVE